MTGLRERKKARTRAEIQRQALRLFREQGYDATPIHQIAEAAEVSESTFFRYFPSKEDVVLWDELDLRGLEMVHAQPLELSPVQALRAAFHQVLTELPKDERTRLRERLALMVTVPPLRATLLDQVGGPMHAISMAIAEREGRRPHDPKVRALAGAVIGVGLSTMLLAAEHEDADVVALVDDAMRELEAGFPLERTCQREVDPMG